MVQPRSVFADDYFSLLKTRAADVRLTSMERSQKLHKTCLGLCRPRAIDVPILREYHSVVQVSKLALEPDDRESFAALKTIYKKLEMCSLEPEDEGNHWETIGFQGSKPGTDLRAVGLLGIVHLLCFLDSNLGYARTIYLYGRTDDGNFPFAVVGINISKIVLDCIREGVLNTEINRSKDLFSTMNLFYQGLWQQTMEIIKGQGAPNVIMEFYKILKAVESVAQNHPSRVIQNYKRLLDEQRKEKNTLFDINPQNTDRTHLNAPSNQNLDQSFNARNEPSNYAKPKAD